MTLSTNKRTFYSHRKNISFWPILAILFFSISSGSIQIFGLPRTIVLSIFVMIVMLIQIKGKLNKVGLIFALCIIFSYFPSTLNSIYNKAFNTLSFLNLISSLAIFVVVFSYVTLLLKTNREKLTNTINWVFVIFTIIACIEIFNFSTIFEIRNIYYNHQLISQFDRDILLYGISRPSGFFTEPSNFARFISILLALHIIASKKYIYSFYWLALFIILIRSPILLYSSPILILAFYKGQSSLRKNQIDKYKRLIVITTGFLFLVTILAFFQLNRIENLLQGEEGSFSGRIALPINYIITAWENPIIGSGATPLEKVNAHVNELFILEGDRHWLIGEEFSIAIAPTLIIVIGMGLLGLLLFFITSGLFIGGVGIVMVITWLLINLLGAGSNAPSMYVPGAFIMAMIYHLRDMSSLHIKSSITR